MGAGTLAATFCARSVGRARGLASRLGRAAALPRLLSVALASSVVLATLFGVSCGYSFRNTVNPWAAKGVTRIYIPMMINNSLKSGIEVPFTSALVKQFAHGTKLRLVSDPEQADAIVEGTINAFTSAPNSLSSVAQLSQDPDAQALSDMVIATEYIATGLVTVRLVKHGQSLWMQQFTHPKIYPAGNRFGLQGDTSVLIDASQEQLALLDIAQFIASDVYDTMMEAF